MPIPTEPIGSIPRHPRLLDALATHDADDPALDPLYEEAVRDTIARFEATGSPVVTDGEQRMPRLTHGPFRYRRPADRYLDVARRYATRPLKQAVISPSAMSLLYPEQEIAGYPREQFIDDLLGEHEREVRGCLRKGAHAVQIDFTEGRLAVKLDPSGALLTSFVHLNNLALSRFSEADRQRIGVHTCPGGDRDSTHSAEVDYAELLPSLFQLKVGNFYIALAGEKDPERVLRIIRRQLQPRHRVFVGVVSPIDPRIDTPEEVCARVLQAARHIPVAQLGTTDDCGFAPFCDDTSTSRDTAFAKIRARVAGTALAARELGVA